MLRKENSLVIVVDVQERLVPAIKSIPDFLKHVTRTLQGIQILGLPVVVTEQYPKGLKHTLPEVSALIDPIAVIEKTKFSIVVPELKALLRQRPAIQNLIIIGAETHVCVLQSVLEALDMGYNVYVPNDVVGSRTVENHLNGLDQMRYSGAIITNMESVLFQLLADAKHPAFKQISALIKS